MFSKILGYIWIALGVLFLVWPQLLRGWLKRKMSRKIRWTVFGFMRVFIFYLIGHALKVSGFLPKLAAIIGVFIIIRFIVLLISKGAGTLMEWWSERPLIYFRIGAVLFLVLGLSLVLS